MSIRNLVISTTLCIACTAWASPSFEFHTDKDLGSATAQVIASDGSVMVELEWNSPLPSGTNGTETLAFVPMRLLGLLRDSLTSYSSTDANDARSWLSVTMGNYYNVATASIPGSVYGEIAIGPNSSSISWCGIQKNADKKCPFDCTPTQNNTVTCQGCGCRGHRTVGGDL